MIRSAIAIGLAMLVFGCGSRKDESDVKTSVPETPAQRYQNCWNDFNAQKWDDFKKCYAPAATSQQPGYGKLSVTGPDAIVKASQDFMKTFPDGRGEPQLILVNGNHISSIYLLKGTNTGPLFAPDGKQLPGRNQPIGLFMGHSVEFDPAGKVVKEIGVLDGVTLENQMGLLKRAGRPLAVVGVPNAVVVAANNDDAEMKNVEIAKAVVEAWNKHDEAKIDKEIADDYALHDLTAPSDQNKKANAEANKAYWKGFPDIKINTDSIWGAGNYVTLTGTLEGTNTGDFAPMKAKATGKKVVLPFVDILRFDGGKLKEEWLFSDGASFITQLLAK